MALYKQIETSHPSPRLRKQAGELRYILEAPRLALGADEKPTLPALEGGRFVTKGDKERRRPALPPRSVAPRPARPRTLEERWAEEWKPPQLLPNRYVAVAVAAVAVGLAAYSATVAGW